MPALLFKYFVSAKATSIPPAPPPTTEIDIPFNFFIFSFIPSIIFINFIDRNVKDLVPIAYNPDTYLPFNIPGTGLIVAIFSLIIIGFFTASFFGKFFVGIGEKLINKLPVFRSIYNALKQVFQTVLGSSSKAFREVVLIEYPRKGSWAVGFATKENEGEISTKTNKELINVFVPTTPNPTSGFLLMFPKNEVVYLDMSFEEASKFIVSAGTSNPKG